MIELPHRSAGNRRRPLCVAHRGASAHAPENTLAAFRKAAELGADMVEMDVHLSADGVPVVIHDADLGRAAGVSGNVYWYRLSELKEFDVGGGERIPTLEEALRCCAEAGLGAYVEIKMPFLSRLVARAIRDAGLQARAIVASFRPDWVAETKACDPEIAGAVLFAAVNMDPVALARAAGAEYVHPAWELAHPDPCRLLQNGWLERVHEAGLHVVSWHEEHVERIQELARLGVDAICTNDPELVCRTLARSQDQRS